MTRYRLEIRVTPRPALLDPEGQAIHGALRNLGFDEVGRVRVGKLIHLDVEAPSEEAARERGDTMGRKLLANPVTEDFEVRVQGEASESTEEETAREPAGGTS